MKHRMKIGTVDRQGVFVNTEISDDGRLSITADILRSGQMVAGGQAIDTVEDVARRGHLAKGITYQQVRKLVEVWKRWHLNDLRAGCEHQRALNWTYDEHPAEPCPVCGYKFGTAWLKEELPADVRQFIEGLAA